MYILSLSTCTYFSNENPKQSTNQTVCLSIKIQDYKRNGFNQTTRACSNSKNSNALKSEIHNSTLTSLSLIFAFCILLYSPTSTAVAWHHERAAWQRCTQPAAEIGHGPRQLFAVRSRAWSGRRMAWRMLSSRAPLPLSLLNSGCYTLQLEYICGYGIIHEGSGIFTGRRWRLQGTLLL